MADLLARLAERTLRTAPAAQPVLASRFDPGQIMTAPILETEAWNTAGSESVQHAATSRRPETGGITVTRGRQEVDIAAPDAATPDPAKTGNRAGGQEVANHLDTDMAGMRQTGIAMVAPGDASTGLVETGSMQSGQPDTTVTGLIQMEADVPAARTTATNSVVTKSGIGPTLVAESAGLPVPLNENPPFVGDPHAQEIEPALPLPELHKSEVELSHPLPDSYKQEVEVSLPAPQLEVMNTLPGEWDSTRRAFASGLPMRQGEPVVLEQEENVSFQPVVPRKSIAPPVEKGRVGAPFEQAVSLQLEETSLPAASIPADSLSEMRPGSARSRNVEGRDERWAGRQDETAIVSSASVSEDPGARKRLSTQSFEDACEEYKVEAELVPTSPENGYISPTGVQKSSPTHAQSSTPSGIVAQVDVISLPLESDEGADHISPIVRTIPRMASSKGLLSGQQEGAGPTSTVDGLKGPLSHPQSLSPLHAAARKEALLLEESVEEAQLSSPGNTAAEEHTIGPNAKQGYNVSTDKKDEIVTLEQQLLVPQAQLQQGIVPQELADGPHSNTFTSGPVRNRPRSAVVQHGPADPQPGSEALTVAAPPTPPSIHITIGRIDVRAITSPGPTPPAKPARPSPLLSLDDYLKQGKGGGQ